MENVKAVIDGPRSCATVRVPLLPATQSPTWTAPLRQASLGVAPAMPSVPAPPVASPTDPTIILDELVGTVDGVRSAILASVDGFGVARSSSMSDEAAHPAMLAAVIGLAHQLVVLGGGSRLRQLVVDHDGGLMLVLPLGDQRVLAVLATTSVEQRRVHSFVHARSAWLSGATW